MNILSCKFGGGTTASPEANKSFILPRIEEELKKGSKVLYTFSAFGKYTNDFVAVYDYFERKDPIVDALIDKLQRSFLDYAEQLFGFDAHARIMLRFKEFYKMIERARHMDCVKAKDRILAYGEILSLDIMHVFLRNRNVPHIKLNAFDLIVTNDDFGNAEIDLEKTRERLMAAIKQSKRKVLLISGFIGKTINGDATVLGREGSDITATACAGMLGASSVTLFKNTKGVLDNNEETIPYLSFDQCEEMLRTANHAFIHPKCIQYARFYDMKIFIKPYNSDHLGTIIYKNPSNE